jgi:alginate O-acetyltransferase complex protein AlgI
MLIVLIGWIFFRVESFSNAMTFVEKMFGLGNEGKGIALHYLTIERVLVLGLAVVSSSRVFVWGKTIWDRLPLEKFNPTATFVADCVYFFMLIYSVMIINSGSYNPFIYFRF